MLRMMYRRACLWIEIKLEGFQWIGGIRFGTWKEGIEGRTFPVHARRKPSSWCDRG